MPPKDVGDPKAEIARLKAKLATIQDRDIRAAIQERVDALAAQDAESTSPLPTEGEGPGVRNSGDEPAEPAAPPTPEQIDRAERLVRQAMLEKQRGNKAAVSKLLEEAVAVAPGAPATLEALGDDFAERGRAKQALDLYKQAVALDPKNVGLERKYATLVLNAGMAGSIEDQLRANLSDSVFLNQGDHIASYGVAKFVSFFMPGLGHVLLGRPAIGFGLLGGWLACFLWIIVIQSTSGGKGHLNSGVYLPALIALVLLVTAVSTLGSDRAAARVKSKPSHPKPPVDLPFD